MASPAVASKTKKSPCLTDSHHLFDAVVKGKIHLTRFILAAANSQLQNSWDKDGRTPLIACCDIKEEGTRDQIVHILLEGGADVNMTDREGRSPLIHACEKRCNDIVRILIHHHNIKPDIEDVYGNTALIYSAAVGNDVATELLTRNFRRLGLLVDHYNKQGNTAILVAAKNGNMNCAKILAQKGRASVLLKDKDHGLTPMEWCLKEGYSKEEVEFLKPNTRFYRVAKLATSLSRSRSSVTSLGQETKPKVSPSKSVDSCIDSISGGHRNAALSRSQSQIVESAKHDSGGGGNAITRQTTIDVPVANYRHLSPSDATNSLPADMKSSFASGMKLKDHKPRKEEKKDKNSNSSVKRADSKKNKTQGSSLSKQDATGSGKSNVSTSLQECMNVSSAKVNRKYVPKDTTSCPQVPESSYEDTAPKRSGRLTGLGCSLSITSMASSATTLDSSDSSRASSRLDNTTHSSRVSCLSDRLNDGANAVTSSSSFETSMDAAVSENTSASSCSAFAPSQSSFTSTSNTSMSEPAGGESRPSSAVSDIWASDHRIDNPGHSLPTSRNAHRNNENASQRVGASGVAGPSSGKGKDLPDEVSSSASGQARDGDSRVQLMMQPCRSDGNTDCLQSTLPSLQGESDTLEKEEQFSDAGHNVLSLVTSSTASMSNYDSQNPHLCSGQEISQDA